MCKENKWPALSQKKKPRKAHPNSQKAFSVSWWIFVILLTGIILTGCQTIKATGERHFALIGEEQEIEMGAQSDEQIVHTFGLYPDESLQAYVQQLGARIAAATERPDLPWTFRVIDDDTVNAFALPGGYIYVTRGIMAHFENEAQMTGVLSHEIAHVTAKHSVIRLSRSMLAELGLGVVSIIVPELANLAPLAGAGLQLLFLSYSRDDEMEADLLGVRYMAKVEENPRELVDVMAMLDRVSATRQNGVVPEWASTHPLPENRIDMIQRAVKALENQMFRPVERQSYLARLDNLVYGKDPREGYTRDSMFYHPELKFHFHFPENWRIINQKKVVIGLSPREQAAIQITLSDKNSLQEAINALSRQEGIAYGQPAQISINALPAITNVFQARTNEGVVRGRIAFIEYGGRIYQVIGYSMQPVWQEYSNLVENSIMSFSELTDPKALAAKPFQLDIVEIDEPVTLRDFYARYNIPVPVEEIARLNQTEPDELLQPGRILKIVIEP
jgi:predicted Zn-dependent protease